MTLEHLIEKAIIDVKYYQDRLEEAKSQLDAFYIAQDAKADNPLSKKMSDADMAVMQIEAEKELAESIMQEEFKLMPDWTEIDKFGEDMGNQEIYKK